THSREASSHQPVKGHRPSTNDVGKERSGTLVAHDVRRPMTQSTLAPVDALRITILMDNVTDPLVFPAEHVERTTWLTQLAPGAARVRSAVSADALRDDRVTPPA